MVQAPAGGGSSSFTSMNKPPSDAGAATAAKPKASSSGVPITSASLPLSARRADPLDLSTVERRGQPNQAKDPGAKRHRLHDIPDAPVYRPTEEEFKDPMEYMHKIAPEGSKYGIVKIIPPDSWNPAFAIDTSRFHFRVRRQELNSVEGGTRANLNYLDQLAKYHRQLGSNLTRFPSVDKRPLDLYKLKKAVEARGGFEQVCKLKKWAEIGRDLGYSGKIMSSLSTSLKNSYQRWLEPYEQYLRIAKPGVQQQLELENGGPYTPSPGPSPIKKTQSQQNTPASTKEETPAMRASVALNASINGSSQTNGTPVQAPVPLPTVAPPQSSPPSRSGFTPANPGGFTAVNARQPPSSFTSVNTPNGHPTLSENGTGTPNRTIESPRPPISGTPSFSAVGADGANALKRSHGDDLLTNGDSDASGRRSKRAKKDGPPTVAGSNMHHARGASAKPASARDRTSERPGEVCERCGLPDKAGELLLCESCDCGYHMGCLEPPVTAKPDYDWNCPRCLVGTGEFGFEEGEVYSLKAFQEKARRFKDMHFADKLKYDPITNSKRPVSEDDVESEFWRQVENLTETVEVEYGADIHSTTHGSGFPTIEKQPRDSYSTDPWNLNVLPLYGESLFRHIKSDISGMTVPWLYVGMVFSTFCWHNEDHYAYSANYQHFGETKTWYGIPAEDAERFENAMREAVPELFEGQPDLLFQLVTLMPPEKLKKAGVRVSAVDQRAGEFVITFPQAYHAGFNHGFNVNEAVNFAPTDWEPFGAAGVERLRTYRKQPCFPHDELLLTAASRDNTIKTAKWLAPALERMLQHELGARSHFLDEPGAPKDNDVDETYRGPRYAEVPEINSDDLEEDDYICAFCKAYSFLSRYICRNSGKVMCLLHAGRFACCDDKETDRYSNSLHDHTLHLRMSSDALETLVQKVVDKAKVPELWAEKVDKLLEEEPRPQLKNLRSLLNEGERIPFPLPQLADLKKFVERCNEWVEEATNYITRKQGRRKSDKPGRKSFARMVEMEEAAKEFRKIDNIRKLLAEADDISFECQEIETLRERAENIASFQREAQDALTKGSQKTTQEYEELCDLGRTFSVDMPEIEQLEQLVDRLKWRDNARDKRGQAQSLKDVSDFIQRGLDMGLHDTDPDLLYYRDLKLQGELWETKAKEVMSVEHVHYQQLDALSKQAVTLPVNPETLAEVDAILKKQREAQDKIVALFEQSKDVDFRKRPMYKEVRDVMEELEKLNSKPAGTIDLEKQQRLHEDWMRRGKKLFGKTNAPLHILHQHMQIVRDRNAGCFDLQDKPRMPVEPASRRNSAEPGEQTVTESGKPMADVFCICRKPEVGMMIECELCHEWYHGKCLKIARGKVKEDDEYTCPICDWRLKIPRDAARPKLEDLQAWFDELETMPFQPEEEETLVDIIDTAQAFRDHIQPYINPLAVTPEEVGTLRFYLRKVEGADILLAYETNFLRQEVHKWAPVAPEPPPVVEQSGSTRKPRPTKQQKLMAQFGVSNPDDLPAEFKIKPSAKRKVLEGLERQRQQQPLQPASGSATSNHPRPSSHVSNTPGMPPAQMRAPSSQHTPSFSYDSQPQRPAYRDSPLFAHSSSFTGPQNAQHPQQSTPSLNHQPSNPHLNSSSPPSTHHFSTHSNLDPALFGPSSSHNMFDKPPRPSSSGTGALGSPSKEGAGLDTLFRDMVHQDDDVPPSNSAGEALAAAAVAAATAGAGPDGEEASVDEGKLDEFINH